MWIKDHSENDLVKGIYKNGIDILEFCETSADLKSYFKKLEEDKLNYPRPSNQVNIQQWLIPKEYQKMDIEEFLVNQCPKQNYDRLIIELELYRAHDMLMVLKCMKFIVDTLRKNNIVWGVGRGSSVASYVLYLIGVHKIDSVKYEIPIEEFFKGEQNG